ncbi:unnamed protein product [Pleuronectes platessa]|uniref:Uncharacterized protein n=1 Tax=Pleuronectes platessa TaxID=8262 RepID=A0A9N7VN74_PLEPL|nr:unnamed protein product [Pleuronectes platessa]
MHNTGKRPFKFNSLSEQNQKQGFGSSWLLPPPPCCSVLPEDLDVYSAQWTKAEGDVVVICVVKPTFDCAVLLLTLHPSQLLIHSQQELLNSEESLCQDESPEAPDPQPAGCYLSAFDTKAIT